MPSNDATTVGIFLLACVALAGILDTFRKSRNIDNKEREVQLSERQKFNSVAFEAIARVASLEKSNGELSTQVHALSAQLDEVKSHLADTQKQLDASDTARHELSDRLETLSKQYTEQQALHETIKKEFGQVQGELKNERTEKAKLQSRIVELESEVAKLNEQNKRLQSEVDELRTRLQHQDTPRQTPSEPVPPNTTIP